MYARRRRWLLLGGAFGAGIAGVVVSALTLFASAGVAARAVRPVNVDPPTISGTPEEGKVLTADRGTWNNAPTDFEFTWRRCDKNGGSCSNIIGAHGTKYTLTTADLGNTLRVRVEARNADGNASSTSVPTAVVQKPAPPTPTTPPRGNGCPSGNGNPDQVTSITGPARLILDALQTNPQIVTRDTGSISMRFHVTSTCGGAVQGALVYATATPFNQWAIPPEGTTGSDGWVELNFNRLVGFPVSGKQQLIAMFARARKPGESPLAGITSSRLFSVPVNLHR